MNDDQYGIYNVSRPHMRNRAPQFSVDDLIDEATEDAITELFGARSKRPTKLGKKLNRERKMKEDPEFRFKQQKREMRKLAGSWDGQGDSEANVTAAKLLKVVKAIQEDHPTWRPPTKVSEILSKYKIGGSVQLAEAKPVDKPVVSTAEDDGDDEDDEMDAFEAELSELEEEVESEPTSGLTDLEEELEGYGGIPILTSDPDDIDIDIEVIADQVVAELFGRIRRRFAF